jgi:hypothetical protein
MLWMVLAFCTAVLTGIKANTSLYLHAIFSVFAFQRLCLPSSYFQLLFFHSAFWFYFLAVVFCPFFWRPKFCCVLTVRLVCSSTFCFPGLALLFFRDNRFYLSLTSVTTTFPFLLVAVLFRFFPLNTFLCTFQFHFHKRTFCVPFRYFYGAILLFLVIPRMTAFVLLCFTIGPLLESVFIFLSLHVTILFIHFSFLYLKSVHPRISVSHYTLWSCPPVVGLTATWCR